MKGSNDNAARKSAAIMSLKEVSRAPPSGALDPTVPGPLDPKLEITNAHQLCWPRPHTGACIFCM